MSIWNILMVLWVINFVVIPSFKDKVIPVNKLIIAPVIFMYLFYQKINENFIIDDVILFSGLIIGIAIGILLRCRTVIKADKKQSLIFLPGNYLGLIIFCLIFSMHFTVGYLQSVNPNYLTHISMGEQILLFLISCASSITIGANGLLYCKYLASKSSELVGY